MKSFKIIALLVAAVTIATSCSKYLDVVPDNVKKLENIYANKEEAYNALAKVYNYLPDDDWSDGSMALLGDESVSRVDPDWLREGGRVRAERIMRGLQTTGDPMLGTWTGSNAGKPLYEAIRTCNIFLQYVDGIRNLTDDEKKDWTAQVAFFKAYYHFLLMRQYGPIIISDKVIEPDALSDELFQKRNKVEDVFDYILDLMDKHIGNLPEQRKDADLGMIDRVGALAIKARILVYRASPFFSGNREFYDDFLDPSDGQKFFDVNATEEQTREKWGKAIATLNEAITLAFSQGKRLYTSDRDKRYVRDSSYFRLNPVKMRQLYDLRFVVTEPWNKELLWGRSNVSFDDWRIADVYSLRLPEEYSGGSDLTERSGYSRQIQSVSYQMLERYYTKNGLPMDEDATFNYTGRNDLYLTPLATDPDFAGLEGIMQPNAEVINQYMNREMRFYANLCITGGYAREHYTTFPTSMLATFPGGWKSNRGDGGREFLATGIGAQKMTHPESQSDHNWRVVRYPWPIIRLADLYLMKAEALNEYKSAPDQEVWDAINVVRERACIPKVEVVYNDAGIVKSAALGKHRNKQGMRDIILRERAIEFAFEGLHFWDMWRYKKAHRNFSTAIQGWNYKATAASDFFVLTMVQPRKFFIKDYLWPIPLNELNTNGAITQNPGW